MAVDIRAQITTESGEMGTKDALIVEHGEYRLNSTVGQREFWGHFRDVLQAADHVAVDGKVTRVSVLVFSSSALERFANNN